MHSWRVWVLAHVELGAAVFHCLFSLVPPVVIFHLTSRTQHRTLFANVLSRCISFRKGCILRTEPGGVPDARKTAKAREAHPGANSLASNQRCSLCSPGACQATHVLEKGRQCFNFRGCKATPRVGSRGPL